MNKCHKTLALCFIVAVLSFTGCRSKTQANTAKMPKKTTVQQVEPSSKRDYLRLHYMNPDNPLTKDFQM